MRRSPLVIVAVIAVAGAIAIPAFAAPDRNSTLNATTTKYEWDGGPVTGTPVNDVEVDDTLLTIETPGSLKVNTKEPDDTSIDLDILVYKSNAAGDPQGDPVKT